MNLNYILRLNENLVLIVQLKKAKTNVFDLSQLLRFACVCARENLV